MTTGITTIRPISDNGTNAAWSSTGTKFYTEIDEATTDEDNTYIYTSSLNTTFKEVKFHSLLNGENPPPHENLIIPKVQIFVRHRNIFGAPTPRHNHRVQIEGWGASLMGTLTNTYATNYKIYTKKGLADITVADVNSIVPQIIYTKVFSSRSNTVRMTQIYIEVTWETIKTVHIKGAKILGNTLLK